MLLFQFLSEPRIEDRIPKFIKSAFDAGRVHFWDRFTDLTAIPKRTAEEPMNAYFSRLSRIDHHQELIESFEHILVESMKAVDFETVRMLMPKILNSYSLKELKRIAKTDQEIEKNTEAGEGFFKDLEAKDIVRFSYYCGYLYQGFTIGNAIIDYLETNQKLSNRALKHFEDLTEKMGVLVDIRPLMKLAESETNHKPS